jgi:integrase
MARNKKCPGYLEHRYAESFRWTVCVGGKYHRYTIKTDDREAAERWARKEFDKLERRNKRQQRGIVVGIKVSDLLTYFENERLPRLAPGTRDAYKDSLKPIRNYFVKQFGDPFLEDVHAADVGDFLDWRRRNRLRGEQPLHSRTLAKDRAVLHRLFEVAQEREWREGNPVAKVSIEKGDNRQPVILTNAEYERLLGACRDPVTRLYVLFCGETGVRCESEGLWARWEDIDLDGGFLTIVSGRGGHRVKGGRTRHVPLTPRLRDALKEHFAQHRFAAYDGRRPEYVFHHTRTRRHYKAGERVRSIRRAVTSAAERAKLSGEWVMHDLRHRRATVWLAEGKSPALVKEALGHADLRTTMGYMHLAKEHLRALVEPAAQGINQGISRA